MGTWGVEVVFVAGMTSALFSVFFVFTLVSSSRGPDDANCLPGTWLPEGSDVRMCDSPGYDYDGSLIPDCNAFHGQVNTTSFFHIHEYDCGLYWTCSPEGPCLMQCAACNVNPSDCPDGRLQFDCRYTVPVGPVCDWATTVKCTNCQETCEALNCPGDQTCDPSTDCQCSDCKTDADCSGGEECCDRVCSADCGGEPTTTSAPPATTPTPATSTTPVPTTTTAPPTPTATTAAQATTQSTTTASTVTGSSASQAAAMTQTALWTSPTAPPSTAAPASLATRDWSRSRCRRTTAPAATPPPRVALLFPLMMTLKQHSHALQVVLITLANVTMIME